MKKGIRFIALALALLMSFGTALASGSGYSSLISGILDDLSTNNKSCSGAPQQLVNGLYRCVEMAAIVATLNA